MWAQTGSVPGHREEERKERTKGGGVIGRSKGAEVEAENGLRAQTEQCVKCVMMDFAEAFDQRQTVLLTFVYQLFSVVILTT